MTRAANLVALIAVCLAAFTVAFTASATLSYRPPDRAWPTAPAGPFTGWPPTPASDCAPEVAGGLEDPCQRSHTP